MKRLLLLAALCVGLASACVSTRFPTPAPTPQTSEPGTIGGRGNPPFYEVFGQRYYVMPDADGYNERGVASWYGGKFHGRSTSSGERYDMHNMTAAHKSLPLPTWVRVTNLRNGSQVVVKVNDRGPFVKNRLIDLSYAAAQQLDMIADGTTLVQVEVLPPPGPAVVAARPNAAESPASSPQVVADPAPATLTWQDMPASPDLQDAGDTRENLADASATDNLHSVSGSTPPTPFQTDRAATEYSTIPASSPRLYIQVGAFGDIANAQRMQTTLYNAAIDNVRLADGMHEGSSVYRVQVGPVADVATYDLLAGQLESLGISDTHLVTE